MHPQTWRPYLQNMLLTKEQQLLKSPNHGGVKINKRNNPAKIGGLSTRACAALSTSSFDEKSGRCRRRPLRLRRWQWPPRFLSPPTPSTDSGELPPPLLRTLAESPPSPPNSATDGAPSDPPPWSPQGFCGFRAPPPRPLRSWCCASRRMRCPFRPGQSMFQAWLSGNSVGQMAWFLILLVFWCSLWRWNWVVFVVFCWVKGYGHGFGLAVRWAVWIWVLEGDGLGHGITLFPVSLNRVAC